MHLYPKRASLQQLGGEIFKLVSYSATPEQWAEWLRVPLEHAAARGNLDLVDTLLQAGADGSAGWKGCRGRTLLDAAAVGGNADVVMALIRAGAQPDVKVVSLSPKRSALYVATVCGHQEVARRLIQAGADMRFEDPVHGRSVLHEAAHGCHEQLVSDLVIGGADPNSDLGPSGSTPLHLAAGGGHAGITSALLLRGANKEAVDQYGGTPLIWAASGGRLAAVENLLAAGADFNTRNNVGNSVLDCAACGGHIPVIKAILGHGADRNSRNANGYSALTAAAAKNQAGAIDALVEAGADIELKSMNGNTPLMVAASYSSAESMLALLKRGAAVTMRNEAGQVPLHLACFGKCSGLEAAVDLLLRWAADETALDISGRTPADLLIVVPHTTVGRRCSQEEVERTRLLLARAPADRAWRRRCWLVMLRSRALKARRICQDNGRNDGGGTSDAARGLARESCKIANTQGTAGNNALEPDAHQRMNTGGSRVEGEVGAGARAEFEGLSGIVALLIGLEEKGVFRTIAGFL